MSSILEDFPATPTPFNTTFDRGPISGLPSQSVVVPSVQIEGTPPPTPRPNQSSGGLVVDESPNFRRRRARAAQLEREQAMEDLMDCKVTKVRTSVSVGDQLSTLTIRCCPQSQLSSLSATFVAVRLEVADLDGLAPYWQTPVVQPMLEHWVRLSASSR